jgi:hypothetical protein
MVVNSVLAESLRISELSLTEIKKSRSANV